MKKIPEVSIIVPVYNVRPYLDECISGVLSQSVSDWELILVDDGSTDGSDEICKRYAVSDNRIKYIRQANKGLSAARNAALDIAAGNYYFFLDGDDVIHPHAVERLLRAIGSEPGVMISAGTYHYSSKKKFRDLGPMHLRVTEAEQLIKDILYQKKRTDNSVCWKLFDRRLFEGLRFYGGWFEDLDIFYRLYERAGRIALTDDNIYFYRRHSDSFINSWSPGRLDILTVTDRMADYIAGHMPRLLPAVRHRRFSACFNILIDAPDGETESKQLCRKAIKQSRSQIISDPEARFKNRLCAVVSYFGFTIFNILSKWASR